MFWGWGKSLEQDQGWKMPIERKKNPSEKKKVSDGKGVTGENAPLSKAPTLQRKREN